MCTGRDFADPTRPAKKILDPDPVRPPQKICRPGPARLVLIISPTRTRPGPSHNFPDPDPARPAKQISNPSRPAQKIIGFLRLNKLSK